MRSLFRVKDIFISFHIFLVTVTGVNAELVRYAMRKTHVIQRFQLFIATVTQIRHNLPNVHSVIAHTLEKRLVINKRESRTDATMDSRESPALKMTLASQQQTIL